MTGGAGPSLEEDVAPLLARPWLLVGIGSDLRGDDAFGPLLARRLAAAGLPAFDAGTSPEGLTGPIVRSPADVLVFADAGRLDAPPGTLRLLDPGDVLPGATSTHDPSLRLLADFLRARRPFTIRVLAVEPARRGLGNPPSPEVLAAVERAARAFGVGPPVPPRDEGPVGAGGVRHAAADARPAVRESPGGGRGRMPGP